MYILTQYNAIINVESVGKIDYAFDDFGNVKVYAEKNWIMSHKIAELKSRAEAIKLIEAIFNAIEQNATTFSVKKYLYETY